MEDAHLLDTSKKLLQLHQFLSIHDIHAPDRNMQVREAAAVSISRLGVTEKIAHNEMSSDE